MPLRLLRDVLALLIAVGAGITGVVVWNHGTVDLGLTLATEGERVVIQDVTPDGNAFRQYMYPGWPILEVVTVDGSTVERGDPIGHALFDGFGSDAFPYPFYETLGGELLSLEEDHRWPSEALSSSRIGLLVAAEVDASSGEIYPMGVLVRRDLELQLEQTIRIAALGLVGGLLAWRLLVHGVAGDLGRKHAAVIAAAVASPALILPAVQVGTPAGIAAGYLLPASIALLLGLSLAQQHPDRQWVQTGVGASLAAAGLAAILVFRYLTGPAVPPSTDRGAIIAVIAAIGLVPAAIAAFGPARAARERASLLSLGAIPAAALTLNGPYVADPILPLVLLVGLVGWHVLPIERASSIIGAGVAGVRSRSLAGAPEPLVTDRIRDVLTIALFALISIFGLAHYSSTYVVLGIALAALVGSAVRTGFLGPDWRDAAVPIAASVSIPILLVGFEGWSYGGEMGWTTPALALTGLSVAHVLASRHSDPTWRRRLLLWTAALGGASVLLMTLWASGANEPLAIALACLVPLVPGLPVAFADAPAELRTGTFRLEALAVALTLAVSALVLTPLAWIPLLAWLIAIVVWRRFTLAPLLGFAQRTQLQRDLAVAAAETERARLAADLHDDALQQLTMLVRTLDEGGQKAAADEAREIATKLRSVVGDLRLPILDDLGAGAALEWLVERVEPFAGGPVKLERSDEARPPANVELAVFRVAQEALTNAIKHGRAPIAVRYDVRSDGRVTLAVDDAGPGIGPDAAEEAPRQGHFGLVNMQQRAEQIGALLDVRRWPAGGTRVALEWRPQ